MDEFILRAVLAGTAIALLSGPLGSLLVWRQMAFFGGALSHAALLGVALGLWLGLAPEWTVAALGVVLSFLLVLLRQRGLSNDSVLALLSHASLAGGMVWLSMQQGVRLDLMRYLFGDILAVSNQDVWVIAALAALGLLLLWRLWDRLVLITLHESLARAEGVPVFWINTGFMAMIAVLVALAVQLVGVLLVTSLLIIPAIAARRFSRSPEAMALIAALLGAISVYLGLWSSWLWDVTTGPAIVLAATAIFVVAWLKPSVK